MLKPTAREGHIPLCPTSTPRTPSTSTVPFSRRHHTTKQPESLSRLTSPDQLLQLSNQRPPNHARSAPRGSQITRARCSHPRLPTHHNFPHRLCSTPRHLAHHELDPFFPTRNLACR